MTDYYVSQVDGNDSYNGLYQTFEGGSDGPWLTIARADNLSGDQSDNSVLFRAGGTWNEQWTLACYGTSGHPFTIGSYGIGAKPIIDGEDTRIFCIYGNGPDYYTVDGLQLQNAINAGTGGGQEGAQFLVYNGTGVIIQNCDIYHPNGRGIRFNTCTNCVATNNLIDTTSSAPTSAYENDNILASAGSGNTLTHNSIYHRKTAGGMYVDGIQTYDEDDMTVAYNFICNPNGADEGDSMLLQLEDGSGTFNVYYNIFYNDSNEEPAIVIDGTGTYNFYNNVIINLAGGGNYIGLGVHILQGEDDCHFINNIFYNGNAACIRADSSVADLSNFDYNCYYRTTDTMLFINGGSEYTWAQLQSAGAEAHGKNSDPLFVDINGEEDTDYKIQSGSPCKDAGADVSLTEDYFGNVVPSNSIPDIGAHEYMSGLIAKILEGAKVVIV